MQSRDSPGSGHPGRPAADLRPPPLLQIAAPGGDSLTQATGAAAGGGGQVLSTWLQSDAGPGVIVENATLQGGHYNYLQARCARQRRSCLHARSACVPAPYPWHRWHTDLSSDKHVRPYTNIARGGHKTIARGRA